MTLCALALIAVALTVIAGCQSSPQVVLPFTGLGDPEGVAVDSAGDLYVTDANRVLKLPAGSASQEVVPFSGLTNSAGVAVDSAGNLYLVVFMGEYRGPNGKYCVLKLPAK
jgi:DNA-binding beta-propeller fold protein YncE